MIVLTQPLRILQFLSVLLSVHALDSLSSVRNILHMSRDVCQFITSAGARGVSLMFSSGDGGVGDGDEDPTTQTCITNNGLNQTKFIPGFPASFVIYFFGLIN